MKKKSMRKKMDSNLNLLPIAIIAVALVGVSVWLMQVNTVGLVVKSGIRNLENNDAEEWNRISATSSAEDIPVGWSFDCGTGTCRIERVADSYSGKYAAYMSSRQGFASVSRTVYLDAKEQYNFSVLVKSNHEAKMKVRRNDYGSSAVTYHPGNGKWEKLTVKITPTSYIPQGWNFIIETSKGGSLIWDHARLVGGDIPVKVIEQNME